MPAAARPPSAASDASPAVRRRSLLAGAAALAGGAALARPALAGAAPAPVAAAAAAQPAAPSAVAPSKHATVLRGLDAVATSGRDAEGRFGLMFKHLPAHAPSDGGIAQLAATMADPSTASPEFDNPDITAGYTFLGQFIDHDMTLDRTPLTQQQSDPRGLTNFDSPLFDLQSVYGTGITSSPDLYEPGGGGRLRVVDHGGGLLDLPRRADGTAHIGDGRNDENVIVAQLHLAFIRFHNRCLGEGRSFAEAQRMTRYHFQWLIVHEFLPRIVGQATVNRFLTESAGKKAAVKREFYKPKNPHRPMMPIEYSAAAYRFGHSMVRNRYLLRVSPARTVSDTFNGTGDDLRGSRPLRSTKQVDWQHFFDVPGRPTTPVNLARRIDTRLAPALGELPTTVVSDGIYSLAKRNLLRARQLGLPSGQAVARAMGVTPLTDGQLAMPTGWVGEAPLWYYVLKEAEVQAEGKRLGDVGGRIVAETILGILDADKGSYFAEKGWRPAAPFTKTPGTFTVGDFVKYAEGQ